MYLCVEGAVLYLCVEGAVLYLCVEGAIMYLCVDGIDCAFVSTFFRLYFGSGPNVMFSFSFHSYIINNVYIY
jgi:hypothetical protein